MAAERHKAEEVVPTLRKVKALTEPGRFSPRHLNQRPAPQHLKWTLSQHQRTKPANASLSTNKIVD